MTPMTGWAWGTGIRWFIVLMNHPEIDLFSSVYHHCTTAGGNLMVSCLKYHSRLLIMICFPESILRQRNFVLCLMKIIQWLCPCPQIKNTFLVWFTRHTEVTIIFHAPATLALLQLPKHALLLPATGPLHRCSSSVWNSLHSSPLLPWKCHCSFKSHFCWTVCVYPLWSG